jgi:AraC-like DNA-binding protein
MYDHRRLFARISRILRDDPGASLRSVASALGVHPHTAAHVVRAHTGISFSAWRRQHRVTLALSLLRTRPDMSIKEIAAASGFGSTSVFDRFVRRTYGCSPSQCREEFHAPAEGGSALCAARPRPAGSIVNALAPQSTNGGARRSPRDATLDPSTACS